jgi:hypothetical protein
MLKAKSGLPKYCSYNWRREKQRVRFRRGVITAYITGTPWSEDFMRQYAALLDSAAPPADESSTIRGWPLTFGHAPFGWEMSPGGAGRRRYSAKMRRGG